MQTMHNDLAYKIYVQILNFSVEIGNIFLPTEKIHEFFTIIKKNTCDIQ